MATIKKEIHIGFLEKCEPWKLHARFFPSKVGGKPAWLCRRPPQPSHIKCCVCTEPLIFLCQIYAPIDNSEDAFHRTLFIFICKSGKCYKSNNADNIKIFRCQLRRDNEFYPYNPPDDDVDEPFDDPKCPPLCVVCGCRGPSHCSKCKSVNYCSRTHQIYDWKNGHKEHCKSEEDQNIKNASLLFPEWELIIEDETDLDEAKEVSEEKEMEYFQKLLKEKKAGSLINESEEELELYANKTVKDKIFNKFKKQVSRDPEQVLRYDRGGEPLWITSPTIQLNVVPDCESCNSKRQFECQIMPQLLNYLNTNLSPNCIDWGILAIYTCSKNCTDVNTPYKTEFIIKQDLI